MNKRTKHGSANEYQDKKFKPERNQTKKKQMNNKFQPKKYTNARNRPTNIFQEKDKNKQKKKIIQANANRARKTFSKSALQEN